MLETRILNNRYSLQEEIGRGGMGVVYRALDLQLNCIVAIKVLPPEFSHDPQFIARFNNEIRSMTQLHHPNIVSTSDLGVDGNTNYYVMQYVDGQDLKAYLAQHGRLTVMEVCRILGQIAAALDFAHAHGIVHRDIKPENIMLDRQGVASLTDFGIARSLEGTRMTTGMIGTPEYMSPEQAKGEDVNGCSDQYSLAIVAYEMLTGSTPFRSSTAQPWAIVTKHITESPVDLRKVVPIIGKNCAEAVNNALAKASWQRYQSCAQFVEAMQTNDCREVKDVSWLPLWTLIGIICLFGAFMLIIGIGEQLHVGVEDPQLEEEVFVEQDFDLPPPSPKTNLKDGAEIIYIPAKKFIMGCNKYFSDEAPERTVSLDNYYIYKTEVTVAQYRKFCDDTNRLLPNEPEWGWQDEHPIVNVSWNDADAYANWAGGELPTEAQWEKAARGGDGRNYPWGFNWDSSRLHCSVKKDGQTVAPTRVGGFPTGASPYGVLDMAGNVYEWCRDWYDEDYYKRAPDTNPTGPENGKQRVLRSGSYLEQDWKVHRVSYRWSEKPDNSFCNVGFRVVVLSP